MDRSDGVSVALDSLPVPVWVDFAAAASYTYGGSLMKLTAGAAAALAMITLASCSQAQALKRATGGTVSPAIVNASTSAAPPKGPAPASSAAGLRSVRTPAIVVDDMKLRSGQCHARVLGGAQGLVLPDGACTPGAVDPAVTQGNLDQTICATGYTETVRPSSTATGKAKTAALAAYGMTAAKTIEYDHLISLQLGGASTTSNLWPEPNDAQATSTTNPKDTVENALRKAVCARKVTLAAAQQAISTDWTTAEQTLGLTH